MSISSVIKSLQDIMRKDAGVDGDAQRLGQLSWLLFLKIFDAQKRRWNWSRITTNSPFRSATCGAHGRRTPKASPAIPCWSSSTMTCSQR